MEGDNWTTTGQGKMNPAQYFDQLIVAFPVLKEKIDQWEPDMNHFRMEEFAVYTQDQISKRDFSELNRCFEFQETRIDNADDDLLNCLYVSFCESLLLGEMHKEMPGVVPLMGRKLQKLYRDYESYYNDIVKKLHGN